MAPARCSSSNSSKGAAASCSPRREKETFGLPQNGRETGFSPGIGFLANSTMYSVSNILKYTYACGEICTSLETTGSVTSKEALALDVQYFFWKGHVKVLLS